MAADAIAVKRGTFKYRNAANDQAVMLRSDEWNSELGRRAFAAIAVIRG